MTVDDLRSLLRAQPFSPFTIHLSDGRSFEIHHPDYLIVPPERSVIVFVFQKGGQWDLVYLRQITSVSGEGVPPSMSRTRGESDAA